MTLTDAEYSRYGIDFLYHITHLDNMRSIRERGMLSHNAAHQARLAKDISNQGANRRRSNKKPFGRALHDYVPLFFNHKVPFLSAPKVKGIQDSVVILCLDRELLCRDGTIFSDGNGANGPTNFFDDVSHLNRLNWDIIRPGRNYSWVINRVSGSSLTTNPDIERIIAAEVLVPDYVPFRDIQRIVVRTGQARRGLENALRQGIIGESGASSQVPISIDARMFYD